MFEEVGSPLLRELGIYITFIEPFRIEKEERRGFVTHYSIAYSRQTYKVCGKISR
ncbi:MAG: hypothetical protein ACXQTS_01430 [Candidatus Methanospirareceae archaeon]